MHNFYIPTLPVKLDSCQETFIVKNCSTSISIQGYCQVSRSLFGTSLFFFFFFFFFLTLFVCMNSFTLVSIICQKII